MRFIPLLALAVLVPVVALATPGDLDSTFNGTGSVATPVLTSDGIASSVVIQADGKIVAGGASNVQINSNFAVARYESDGDLDTSFSDDGKLTIDFFGSTDVAENIAIQGNGKIVLGGLARDSVDGYGVARVLP